MISLGGIRICKSVFTRILTVPCVSVSWHCFLDKIRGFVPRLGIGTTKNHAYVNGPGCPADAVLYTEENAKALPELLETFRQMGFEQSDVDSVQKQLAAILLIGDTKFAEGISAATWSVYSCPHSISDNGHNRTFRTTLYQRLLDVRI